jgi:hypothetical protein
MNLIIKRKTYVRGWMVSSVLTTFIWLGASASAQTLPDQDDRSVQDNNRSVQDNNRSVQDDIGRQEIVRFDQFLDNHREIDDRLRKDPSLVDNRDFLQDHQDLRDYLRDHPRVREEITAHPDAFMRREERFDRRESERRDDDRDRQPNGYGRRDDDRDRDIRRQELVHFDEFLDNHREVDERLRKDPALVDNREFVQSHPELQAYLQDHPRISEDIKADPNAFMHREERLQRHDDELARQADRRDDDRNGDVRRDDDRNRDLRRDELAHFDQFLDTHRETAEQLRKDPSLADNGEFVNSHPALMAFLKDHPGVREQLRQDPNGFLRQEDRLDRRDDDRNRDVHRDELAHFDQFLDTHRETAEQLRRDPSLADNQEFLRTHPALQSYLQDHPGIHEQLAQNPNAFVRQEERFDRHDDGFDRDAMHRQFGEFLGGHSAISQQLQSDPTLVNNKEFMTNHPELQDYLNSHPDARQEFMKNPQEFVNSAQHFNGGTNTVPSGAQSQIKTTPTANPKPNR